MNMFEKIFNYLEKIQMFLGITCLALIAAIIPLQVFYRYFLNTPLMWTEEIAMGLLVWLGFLGSAILHRRKGHVTVEFFLKYFNQKVATVISFLLDVVIAALILLVIVYAHQLNELQMMSHSSITDIPRGYFFALPLFVNFITMFLYSLYTIIKKLDRRQQATPKP